MAHLIEVKDAYKIYNPGENEVHALDGVSLTVDRGEFLMIVGHSGSGKSTLMNMLGLLDICTSGEYLIDGKDVSNLSDDELSEIRNKEIGFIFQGFNLIPSLTAKGNVELPLIYRGVKKEEREKLSVDALRRVGLEKRMNHLPSQMSGGQQQRIAIARALATNPKVLLCDEATSALDPNTTHSILNLIRDINKKLGITVIIITHQMSVVEETCNRVAILDNGTVVEQGEVSTVFAHPQSAAAKRLVFPDASDEIFAPASDEHRIRVVFNGAFATNTPLITKMAMDEGIAANILAASTRCIGDKVYGNMLLGIPGGDNELERASKYLQSMPDILVEEV